MSTLYHEISGQGPLLLLLHPVGLDRTFWCGLNEVLSKHYTVVAVDSAGHGNSPDARRPGRMSDRVRDTVELLEELDRGPAILIGISFGGMIAQQVALARPDLVSGLVLGGCPGAIPEPFRDAIKNRGADAERSGMEAVVESTLERWFTPMYASNEAVASVRKRILDNTPSNWAAAWEAVSEHDAIDRLRCLKIPALVVAGELDLATSLEAKRALAAAIPDSRLVIMPGAPHMMQIEQSQQFADVVGSFLEQRRAT